MTRSVLLVSIGKQVNFLRKSKKLTLLNLASICNISEKHLGQIERGKANPTIELMENIAKNLGVDFCDLLPTEENTDKDTMLRELTQIFAGIDAQQLKRIYAIVKASLA